MDCMTAWLQRMVAHSWLCLNWTKHKTSIVATTSSCGMPGPKAFDHFLVHGLRAWHAIDYSSRRETLYTRAKIRCHQPLDVSEAWAISDTTASSVKGTLRPLHGAWSSLASLEIIFQDPVQRLSLAPWAPGNEATISSSTPCTASGHWSRICASSHGMK